VEAADLLLAERVPLGVLGSFCSSRLWSSWSVPDLVTQLISVPPELRLTQVVSSRRARASATVDAASGVHWTRTSQRSSPSTAGSVSPRTRSIPSVRSREKRRATVWSETSRAAAMRLNGARGSSCSACTSCRSSRSKLSDPIVSGYLMSKTTTSTVLAGA
jgi:hypothetical protein